MPHASTMNPTRGRGRSAEICELFCNPLGPPLRSKRSSTITTNPHSAVNRRAAHHTPASPSSPAVRARKRAEATSAAFAIPNDEKAVFLCRKCCEIISPPFFGGRVWRVESAIRAVRVPRPLGALTAAPRRGIPADPNPGNRRNHPFLSSAQTSRDSPQPRGANSPPPPRARTGRRAAGLEGRGGERRAGTGARPDGARRCTSLPHPPTRPQHGSLFAPRRTAGRQAGSGSIKAGQIRAVAKRALFTRLVAARRTAVEGGAGREQVPGPQRAATGNAGKRGETQACGEWGRGHGLASHRSDG